MIPVLKEFFVSKFRLESSTGPQFSTGVGSPENIVAAPQGSVYLDNTGGESLTFYVKETGTTGSTGWRNHRQLSKRDLDNLVNNPYFLDGDLGWTKTLGWSISSDVTNAYIGDNVASVTTPSASAVMRDQDLIDCEPGDIIYASAMLKTSASFAATTFVSRPEFLNKSKAIFAAIAGSPSITAPQTTYTDSVSVGVAPANTAYVRHAILSNNTVGTAYLGRAKLFKIRNATEKVGFANSSRVELRQALDSLKN
jgi:hypothetical protein